MSGPAQSQQHTQQIAFPPGASSAPLPSPSASQPRQSYFESSASQAQPRPNPSSRSVPPDCKQTRDSAGATAQQTTALLNDLNLVAEAAKRAQMACLMRDMEGVEL